jgi:hypothetical protein
MDVMIVNFAGNDTVGIKTDTVLTNEEVSRRDGYYTAKKLRRGHV